MGREEGFLQRVVRIVRVAHDLHRGAADIRRVLAEQPLNIDTIRLMSRVHYPKFTRLRWEDA
jgi:hypothetical protein